MLSAGRRACHRAARKAAFPVWCPRSCSTSGEPSLLAHGARDQPWRQWRRLQAFLETGQVCVIDGSNATEIQRRGGRPAEGFAGGAAPISRPDLCQEVHAAYLESGADVIITHTFAATGNAMGPSGNGGRVAECILNAASTARRATLNHVASHAAQLAHEAATSASTAAHAARAAATAAARATTSFPSNESARQSAEGSAKTAQTASEAAALALHAMREVHACAAASSAACAASTAASEGEPLLEARPVVGLPDPVPTQGWDAAGFGPALVVGSMSTHFQRTPGGEAPSPDTELANYLEAVKAHRMSGVDMLWLEMMKDEAHAERACQAAVESKLPIFLGMSCRIDEASGRPVLLGNGRDAIPLKPEWFQKLASILGPSLVGVNVMHTKLPAVEAGLRFVREDCGWEGPLGAYPEHGEFVPPNWVFQELDSVEAFAYVDSWIKDFNVQLVGGCCGLGPEFITALSSHIRRHNYAVRSGREHA